MDVLEAINEAPCDDAGRPLQVCLLSDCGHGCGTYSTRVPHVCSMAGQLTVSFLCLQLWLFRFTSLSNACLCRTSAFDIPSSWTIPPLTLGAWRATSPMPHRRRRWGRVGWWGISSSPTQHPGCLTLQCKLATCRRSSCPQLPEHGTVSAALLRSLQTTDDWRTTGCRMRRLGTPRKSKRPTGERPSWLQTSPATTGYHVFRYDSAAALVQGWHAFIMHLLLDSGW